MTSIRWSVGCLFMAGHAVLARFENFSSDNYGSYYNYSPGPWNLSLTEFEGLLDNPKETNKVHFLGPNVSAPYPASPLTSGGEGWSWQASVVADIPLDSSQAADIKSQYTGKFFTGSRLVLKPPPSLLASTSQSKVRNATVDRSWDVCILQWRPDDSYPNQLRSDNGSCLSTLSSQCIADFEAAAARVINGDEWYSCKCPFLQDIATCNTPGGMNKLDCQARRYNATEVAQWPNGQLEVVKYGGQPHDKGDAQAYNQTASLAWPVAMVWMQKSNTHPSGTYDITNKGAKMACVRSQIGGSSMAENAPAGPAASGTRGTNVASQRTASWVSLVATIFLATIAIIWDCRG